MAWQWGASKGMGQTQASTNLRTSFVTYPTSGSLYCLLGSRTLGRQRGYSRVLWAKPSRTVLPNQIELASREQVASFGGYAVQWHTEEQGINIYNISRRV